MICIYAESPLCTFTFIIYTGICIPFLQTAQSILRIFNFLLNPHDQPQFEETPIIDLDLPVSCYQDLGTGNGNRGEAMRHEEETCAICLTEFDKEDLVTKLRRCGHVFHMECMEKWIDRCQFTCPLCRSLVLHPTASQSCKIWDSAYCTLPPAHLS